MPELAAKDVERVAHRVAQEKALPIRVIGAIVRRGSDYVEILVNIVGCASEPCQVSIGVFRDASEEHLSQEIGRRLQRHFDEHHAR